MDNRAIFIVGGEPAPKLGPNDPGRPLDFTLTPRERDLAAFGTVHLERVRRERNRRDDAASLAKQLDAERDQ